MASRVINAKAQLDPFLKKGDAYLIGFGVKSLTTEGIHYRDLNELIKGNINELLVRGRKGPLRENISGKYIRKQPEKKVLIEKHIKYIRKDGAHIEYDRTFEVWEKSLLHQFRLKLFRGRSPQQETILHFHKMEYSPNDPMCLLEAKAAMNIAILLGGYFQIYNKELEPILKITETLTRKILEKGGNSVAEKLDLVNRQYFDEGKSTDNSGNSYRFSVLKDYDITDVYDGQGGFNEYLIFEFANDNIIILENLRSGNATYIFDMSKYDKTEILNKTTAQKHKSFIARIIHHNMENWKSTLSRFLRKTK